MRVDADPVRMFFEKGQEVSLMEGAATVAYGSKHSVNQLEIFLGIHRPSQVALVPILPILQDPESLGPIVQEGRHMLTFDRLFSFGAGHIKSFDREYLCVASSRKRPVPGIGNIVHRLLKKIEVYHFVDNCGVNERAVSGDANNGLGGKSPRC